MDEIDSMSTDEANFNLKWGMILIFVQVGIMAFRLLILCWYKWKIIKKYCCCLYNIWKTDKEHKREVKRIKKLAETEAVELQSLSSGRESRVITGPYAIADAENNANYLEPKASVVYTNVVPKTKKWHVMADDQVVEVPQYHNMDGHQASPGDLEPEIELPAPKLRSAVF